jgi:hypothetical protein
MTKSEIIAQLNDIFRKTGFGGKIVITSGIANLNVTYQSEIFQIIRLFNDFTKDNDPYDEHDFGIIKIFEKSVYWKIDYYDKNYEYGSEDPADPNQTKRVLTIMLAEEY